MKIDRATRKSRSSTTPSEGMAPRRTRSCSTSRASPFRRSPSCASRSAQTGGHYVVIKNTPGPARDQGHAAGEAAPSTSRPDRDRVQHDRPGRAGEGADQVRQGRPGPRVQGRRFWTGRSSPADADPEDRQPAVPRGADREASLPDAVPDPRLAGVLSADAATFAVGARPDREAEGSASGRAGRPRAPTAS